MISIYFCFILLLLTNIKYFTILKALNSINRPISLEKEEKLIQNLPNIAPGSYFCLKSC